jgi:hypothetical protein
MINYQLKALHCYNVLIIPLYLQKKLSHVDILPTIFMATTNNYKEGGSDQWIFLQMILLNCILVPIKALRWVPIQRYHQYKSV